MDNYVTGNVFILLCGNMTYYWLCGKYEISLEH